MQSRIKYTRSRLKSRSRYLFKILNYILQIQKYSTVELFSDFCYHFLHITLEFWYKMPPFPSTSWKRCRQGPPKLPEGRRHGGSFGGSRAASFSGGRGKRCHFNIINWSTLVLWTLGIKNQFSCLPGGILYIMPSWHNVKTKTQDAARPGGILYNMPWHPGKDTAPSERAKI